MFTHTARCLLELYSARRSPRPVRRKSGLLPGRWRWLRRMVVSLGSTGRRPA